MHANELWCIRDRTRQAATRGGTKRQKEIFRAKRRRYHCWKPIKIRFSQPFHIGSPLIKFQTNELIESAHKARNIFKRLSWANNARQKYRFRSAWAWHLPEKNSMRLGESFRGNGEDEMLRRSAIKYVRWMCIRFRLAVASLISQWGIIMGKFVLICSWERGKHVRPRQDGKLAPFHSAFSGNRRRWTSRRNTAS